MICFVFEKRVHAAVLHDTDVTQMLSHLKLVGQKTENRTGSLIPLLHESSIEVVSYGST